jgi:hypothetical protein
MNNEEARFILGAYRPDGRDADDPTFGPALGQAETDPQLRQWFERQRKFDAALAGKLQQIAPPPGLREAILTGSRVSGRARPTRASWFRPTWLAAAAALAILAALGVVLRPANQRPSGSELAAFALSDLASAHDDHVARPPTLAAVQTALASARLPLPGSLNLNLDELRQQKCRSVQLGGRELLEVCFQRDGSWFHVYVGRRQEFAPGELDPKALMQVQGQFASTAWADRNHVYALVTRAGAAALRRVI